MTWVPWLFPHDIPQVPYREHLKEGCLEGAKCCSTVTTRSVLCAKNNKWASCLQHIPQVTGHQSLKKSGWDIGWSWKPARISTSWFVGVSLLPIEIVSTYWRPQWSNRGRLGTLHCWECSALLAASGDPAQSSPHITPKSLALIWYNKHTALWGIRTPVDYF